MVQYIAACLYPVEQLPVDTKVDHAWGKLVINISVTNRPAGKPQEHVIEITCIATITSKQ